MGNVLVCDDERSICELLDIALRRDGHKVETVTGGLTNTNIAGLSSANIIGLTTGAVTALEFIPTCAACANTAGAPHDIRHSKSGVIRIT